MRSNYDLAVVESIRTLHDYGYNEAPIQLRNAFFESHLYGYEGASGAPV